MNTMTNQQRRALLLFVRDERREAALKPLWCDGIGYSTLNRSIIRRLASVDADVIVVAESRRQAGASGIVQHGDTFGARLLGAVAECFTRGYAQAVIVGNDCPTIETRDVEHAFAILEHSAIVAAPTPDGGAFLLGFRASDFPVDTLLSLPWCTPSLFAALTSIDGSVGLPIERRDYDDWRSREAREALSNLCCVANHDTLAHRLADRYRPLLRRSFSRYSSPAP